MCFEAADSIAYPTRDSLDHCDAAIGGQALSAPDQVATYVNRGILRSRLGNLEGALVDFDAALAIDANQPEAYLNKGVVLMRRENPDAALPLFTQALENKTRRPALAYYGRGIAHEELGNLKSAYADYTRAVAEDPKWKEPKRELARFVVRK